MNDAAQHMRMLREGWKSMGFQPLTLYVHDSEVEAIKGYVYERTGDTLLSVLPKLDHDQLMHLVARKTMPIPHLGEVAMMGRKLEDAGPKVRKRFDTFSSELTDYLILKKRYETLDFGDDASMLYAGAEAYAMAFKLYGSWLLIQEWYGDV